MKKSSQSAALPKVADLDAAIAKVLAYTTKQLGRGAVVRLGDQGAYPEIQHVVSTGLPALDAVFGCGGLPLSKLVMVSGPESSGKTTFVKHMVAQCQRAGIVPVTLDSEQSGVLAYDTGLGVQPDHAVGGQPDTLEDVFTTIEVVIDGLEAAKALGCIFFDSVAATPLAAELERGMDEEGRMAERAGYLSRHLPKLFSRIKSGRVGLCFTNQLREKVGALPYQRQTYSPGGRALRHFAHVHLETTPLGYVKEGDRVVGIKTRFKAAKNKLARPGLEALLEIRFNPPQLIESGAGPKRVAVQLPE